METFVEHTLEFTAKKMWNREGYVMSQRVTLSRIDLRLDRYADQNASVGMQMKVVHAKSETKGACMQLRC